MTTYKKYKIPWEYDSVVEAIRSNGIPCNRNMLREIAIETFMNETEIKDMVELVKQKHIEREKNKLERQKIRLENKIKNMS